MIIQYANSCVVRTPLPPELFGNFPIWNQLYTNGNIVVYGNNTKQLSPQTIECLALLNRPQDSPAMKMN